MHTSITEKQRTAVNPAINATVGKGPMKRLLSLDVARGITIAFMIMVNNNGGPGSWRFMNHAYWNGLTPTDLVFPTFVFVVGVSVVFAFDARLAKGTPRAQLAKHTVIRTVVLILLGIVVNSFPFFHLAHMRFYGVLQRIAICYLVVGLFYLWDQRASTKWIALAAALIGYWVLVRWVPIPGWGLPGRDLPFLDVNRNLVSWIDQHLFPYHLYLYSPDHNVRDPAERSACHRHGADGRTGRLVAEIRTKREAEVRRVGDCLVVQPRRRLPVVDGVSAKQEHVDQFVRAGRGRLLAGAADLLLLHHRTAELAQTLDMAMARLRFECHWGIHVQ
jgi:heparan-alpha-glucosaminide N-acetyltransferase-like protein